MRDALSVGGKELRLAIRGRTGAAPVLAFAGLLIVVMAFAFGPSPASVRVFAPGALWVTFFFAGELGLANTFTLERENATLEGFLLTPADRLSLFLGKMVGGGSLLVATEAVGVPVYLFVFGGLPHAQAGLLVASLLLGDLGFLSVGILLAAISAQVRAGEALYPLLLFPVTVPVLLAAVETTGAALGAPLTAPWWLLLVAYDVLFLGLALILFDTAVEVA